MRRIAAGLAVLPVLWAAPAAKTDPYGSIRSKLDLIESDKLKPGARVTLTSAELAAYAEAEVAKVAPQGVREPNVKLANGRATGTAFIDFAKLRESQGNPPGTLLRMLLSGERFVQVAARVRSGGGRATVDVESVSISGLTISGSALEYLIDRYLRPLYPTAKIGEPFELGHRIDRVEITPAAAAVVIGAGATARAARK